MWCDAMLIPLTALDQIILLWVRWWIVHMCRKAPPSLCLWFWSAVECANWRRKGNQIRQACHLREFPFRPENPATCHLVWIYAWSARVASIFIHQRFRHIARVIWIMMFFFISTLFFAAFLICISRHSQKRLGGEVEESLVKGDKTATWQSHLSEYITYTHLILERLCKWDKKNLVKCANFDLLF